MWLRKWSDEKFFKGHIVRIGDDKRSWMLNHYIFILKMATAMFATTVDNFQQ
jgi:hypothetical protein